MTSKRRITALALFAATAAATTVLLPATTAAQQEGQRTTVERATEVPLCVELFCTGGGRRGTAICPNTHPYLWNKQLAVLGFFTQSAAALPKGVQVTTKAPKWGVEVELGNTPAGRRAVGATFHARHDSLLNFTGSERFTMVIHCTSDPNESYYEEMWER